MHKACIDKQQPPPTLPYIVRALRLTMLLDAERDLEELREVGRRSRRSDGGAGAGCGDGA